MNLYLSVTDTDWFSFLADERPDEVNFWRPGGGQSFRAIGQGDLFLFKLKAPYNAIGGGGFFQRYSRLPVSLAWQAFERKNGVADHASLLRKIVGYRSGDAGPVADPTIGCLILVQPFFFPQDEWIPVPDSFARNIMQGKTYDASAGDGARLVDAVTDRLARYEFPTSDKGESVFVEEPQPRYGDPRLIRPRLGQGSFRVEVMEAYNRRCSITGEKTLPVLQASHIKPYAESGPHEVRNGLFLRSDLHILFDRGLVTVTDDYRVEVSPAINDEWSNGREYYAMHGRPLASVPEQEEMRPAKEFVRWHNERVWRG